MGFVGTFRDWPGLRPGLRGLGRAGVKGSVVAGPASPGSLATLGAEMPRTDVGSVEKALLLAERSLAAVGLGGAITLGRHDFFELTRPPTPSRCPEGLAIRTAGEADLDGVCAVAETPPRLVVERLRRGDLVYIGVLDGRVSCHAWFHRGPRPFTEDQPPLARWALDAATFWSYGGAAAETRGSGTFVDVFQTALADLFRLHGAERVQCRIRRTNIIAALLHERIGFQRVGTMTGFGTPWLRSLVWLGPPVVPYVLGPNSATAIAIPPPLRRP